MQERVGGKLRLEKVKGGKINGVTVFLISNVQRNYDF